MTWKSFHTRSDTLHAVIEAANTRRDGVLPTDIDGVADTFRDDLDLLATLQLKWHTRLAGRIERIQAHQPLDLPASVMVAWQETARELGGVRLVLDHHRAHPTGPEMARVMAKSALKEHAMLAAMAGLAGVSHEEEAALLGARLEERARLGEVAMTPLTAEIDLPDVSFLTRLKAALAA